MRALPLLLSLAATLSACGPSSAAPPVAPLAPPSAAPPSAPGSAAPGSAAPGSAAPGSQAPETHAMPASGPPGELPTLVRKLLDGRMLRHGTDLGSLHNAVQAGDFAAVATHARNIADEPRIARPLADDDTLNQTIPPAFFDVQDLLHVRAEALSAAAEARDPARVRSAYEELGQTCGRCHQLWFPMPSD